MKRVIALLLCVVLMLPMLAACNDDAPEEAHVHTFADKWTSDAVGHWYAVTCGCADAKINKLAHTDANNDGACDVCTYTNHIHTYSEEWTVDCTNHWHAADCGHIVAGTDVAAHTDADSDGKCDVCTWVIEDIHEHYYATEWSNDDEYHWHAALCEHNVEVADKAAHELNAAGYCNVCDAKIQDVNEDDLAAILAAAAVQNKNIINGDVMYQYLSDGYAYSTTKTFYVLGNGSTYVNRVYGYGSEWPEVNQIWMQDLGQTNEAGEALVFGVISTDGGVTISQAEVSADDLCGYYYAPSTLTDGHGIEELLINLYALTEAGSDPIIVDVDSFNAETTEATYTSVSDLQVSHDKDENLAVVTFNYLIVRVIPQTGDEVQLISYYYTVTFAFLYSEDYAITAAEVYVSAYSDGSNVAYDDDYDYDPATGEVTMSEYAGSDDYCYSVTQVEGTRTYNTIYPKEALVPSDFEFYTDLGEKVEGELTVENGSATYLYFRDLAPITSRVDFFNSDDFTVTVVNNSDSSEEAYVFYPFVSTYSGYMMFVPQQVGSYTITVEYADVVKTINLTVTPALPQSVGAYIFNWTQGYDEMIYNVTKWDGEDTITLAPGETVDFTAKVDPAAAAQGWTYSFEGEGATLTEVTLENVIVFYEDMDTFTALQFKADVAGEYVITFKSTEDETVTGTLTIIVEEEPTGQTQASYDFVTPGSFDKTDEVTFIAGKTGTYVITAEGLAASTWLQYYDAVEDMWPQMQNNLPFSIHLNEGDELNIRLYGWDAADAGTPVTVHVAFDIGGTYIGTDDYDNSFLTVTIDSAAQTVEFAYNHPVMGSSTVNATYEIVDGAMKLYDELGNELHPMAGMITLTDGVPTAAAYNGNNYTLAKSGASDDDDNGTGSGTANDPYALEESNSCDFPGGYDYVFYSYTAETAGTLTITVTSSDYYWGYGEGAYSLTNVGSSTPSADITLAAGETILIGMSTNSTDAAVVTFTASFEADA